MASSRSSRTREASNPSIRSTAPAAAAAAPAGISPTSSEPTTSAPRASASAAIRVDDVVQCRGLPVLDVHRHLHKARARQIESERPHAGETAAPLAHDRCDLARDRDGAAEVDVERDQRRPRPEDHPARGRVQLGRPEVGYELTRREPPLELGATAAAVERRPALGWRVEEHGQAELADASTDRRGSGAGPLKVVGPQRHDRDDVRCADARMRAVVLPQIDPLHCTATPATSASRSSSSVPTSV